METETLLEELRQEEARLRHERQTLAEQAQNTAKIHYMIQQQLQDIVKTHHTIRRTMDAIIALQRQPNVASVGLEDNLDTQG